MEAETLDPDCEACPQQEACAAAVQSLQAENERLRAALAPFADYAVIADARPRLLSNAAPLDYRPGAPTGLTLGDCRQARAVLAGDECDG